jgi:DNA-binding transcriptional regulator LsrR (DeoR family)
MGGGRMKGMDTIARVRQEHFVRGKTIKEIARDLHLSRNTVRKILRSGLTSGRSTDRIGRSARQS